MAIKLVISPSISPFLIIILFSLLGIWLYDYQRGENYKPKKFHCIYMVIRKILLLGNPALREKADKVYDLSNGSKIFVDLKDTLTHLQGEYGMGRGIAAPQIGYQEQVIFIQIPERSFYLVNPKILSRSSETFEVWDSCFSMKAEFFVKIPRNKSITVEYIDEENMNHVEEFRDGLSELLQHEIDHLDGVLCSDHLRDPKDIVMYEEWLTRYRKQGLGM